MESVLKLREPAAVVALVVVAVRVLLVPVTAVLYLRSGASGGLSGISGLLSYRAVDPLLVVVLTGLVASCILTGPTTHARTLAAAALVVVTVSLLVGLVFATAGLLDGSALSVVTTLDQLALFAVPVIALVALFRLRSLAPARSAAPTTYAVPGSGVPVLAEPPVPPDEQYQPSWLPGTAAGAAWQRAGDAAAGAPASGWGSPGSADGWQVAPGQPPPPSVPGWNAGPGSDQPSWAAPEPPRTAGDAPLS